MASLGSIRINDSDDDLRLRVASFLNSRHFPAFQELDVDVHHGAVTLSGTVSSFYEKQVALNSCQRVAGVLSLVDGIDVKPVGMARMRDRDWKTPSPVAHG
jgi:osmotically-inducible protein OsmY